MARSETNLRTALLTTGKGALPNAAFHTLKKHTNLAIVVFSKRERHQTLWQSMKDYGLWYSLQFVFTKIMTKGRKSLDSGMLRNHGIKSDVWCKGSDPERLQKVLHELDVDVVIVCSFQFIIKRKFYSAFRYVINIHPSYLPEYRGPEPIVWGILEKCKYFGVSFHLIDEGIDTGAIIVQSKIPRPFFPLVVVIENSLSSKLIELLRSIIEDIANEKVTLIEQGSGFYLPPPTIAARRARKSAH